MADDKVKKKKLKKRKVRVGNSEEIIQSYTEEGIEIVFQKSQSSTAIRRDPKGNASYEVKVYADNEEEATTKALAQFKRLDGEFQK